MTRAHTLEAAAADVAAFAVGDECSKPPMPPSAAQPMTAQIVLDRVANVRQRLNTRTLTLGEAQRTID